MAQAKQRKLGVLGVGEGRSILSAVETSACWETTCICDLDADLCRLRMQEHPVGRYTTSYGEMLGDPDIDAIAIFTPDPLHADHCLQALRAGKHVLCTKPLVDDLSRGAELLEVLRSSGKQLMVGMSCRFFETFIEQRKRWESGSTGELLSVEAHYHGDKRAGTSGRWGKKSGNNWIYTGLVHPVDLAYWYLGLPASVFGFGQVSPAARARGLESPDNFHFVLQSASGVPMRVSGCFGAPANHPEAEPMIGCVLRGSRGCLDARYPAFELYAAGDEQESVKVTRSHKHAHYFRWGGCSHHAGEFQNYLDSFAQCLSRNAPPLPNAEDGLRVVATLQAMEISLQEGKPVRPADLLRRHGLDQLLLQPT